MGKCLLLRNTRPDVWEQSNNSSQFKQFFKGLRNMDFLGTLQLILIVLKIAGLIEISWWLVLIPLFLAFLVVIIGAMVSTVERS